MSKTYILEMPEWLEYNRETIENYLLHGYMPGSFWESVICNDLYGASCKADAQNSQRLPDLVKYVWHNFPNYSFGNKQMMHDWCRDKNGLRTAFKEDREKRFTVRSLKGETNEEFWDNVPL